MKKSVYALAGAVMIVVATLTRTVAGGGAELLLLIVVGLALLIASADLPQARRSTQ
jgi:membrane-bound ClpP family serine protease